jgi:hypothetical protein
VPWCASCDRFLSPSTVLADGACPGCGTPVDKGKARSSDEEDDLPPIPWHLKLLLVAIAVYLGYRLFQGVEWLASLL